MRADTKKRKNATQMLRATQEQEWWADQVVQVMLKGKRALDTAMLDIGRLVAETLMYMEREEKSGPDYHPTSSGLRKWASQRGSIYIGDQKLSVEHLGCAARRVRSACARTSSSRIAGASRRNSWRRCYGGCLLAKYGDERRQALV